VTDEEQDPLEAFERQRSDAEAEAARITRPMRGRVSPDWAARLREHIGGGDSQNVAMKQLAERLATLDREADEAAAQQRKRMSAVAQRLAAAQIAAQDRGDSVQEARINEQQESLEVARATYASAEAIRKAVVGAIEAAEVRDTALGNRQKRMEWVTWGLLLFAALALAATIISAANAHG
jgi:hypothetical protein